MKGRKRSWMAIASCAIVVAATVLAVVHFYVSTDSNIEGERRMEREHTAADGGLFEKVDTALHPNSRRSAQPQRPLT